MQNNAIKYVIGAIILGLVALVLLYVLRPGTASAPAGGETAQAQVATSSYTGTTFSIEYPADYTLNASYAYDAFGPKKLIQGVKFVIPGSITTGTNLSASDTGVSVESLPRAKNCTGDIYIQDNVKAQEVTEGGVVYSVATTSGAGAGNFYEEQVFALVGSSPCTAVRYFIHSGNIGNYEPGTAVEFNRDALLASFDAIRRSLVLTSAAPSTTTP